MIPGSDPSILPIVNRRWQTPQGSEWWPHSFPLISSRIWGVGHLRSCQAAEPGELLGPPEPWATPTGANAFVVTKLVWPQIIWGEDGDIPGRQPSWYLD